eukprot:32378-Eustigmatos_ZCMA.PRE.1
MLPVGPLGRVQPGHKPAGAGVTERAPARVAPISEEWTGHSSRLTVPVGINFARQPLCGRLLS